MFGMKKYRSAVACMVMLLAVMIVFCSCSGDDYLNVIPAKSTALVSIDLPGVASQKGMSGKDGVLKEMLHADDLSKCGIDVTEKVYLFETQDGTLGLCAKVDDEDDVTAWLTQLEKERCCTAFTERKGYHFTVLNGSWLVGFSSKALLVMGPVVADAQAELQRQMTKMLGADEKLGVKESRLFGKLDSISSPVAMAAYAQALPEKFVAPFTIGAPKDADASQIVISAGMTMEDGVLHVTGSTSSFRPAIDKALQEAMNIYQPIAGDYLACMPSDATAGIFMHVYGPKFLPLLQRNSSMQTLLMGLNTAIDMDNIVRSIDGDLSIVLPSFGEGNWQMKMVAKLSLAHWLMDVDYWKKSCPAGTSITDCGKDAFHYTDGKTSFYFGVTEDQQFYSGNDLEGAKAALLPARRSLPVKIQQMIQGQKVAMVVNLSLTGGGKDAMGAVSSLLSPLFGDVACVVYTMK